MYAMRLDGLRKYTCAALNGLGASTTPDTVAVPGSEAAFRMPAAKYTPAKAAPITNFETRCIELISSRLRFDFRRHGCEIITCASLLFCTFIKPTDSIRN